MAEIDYVLRDIKVEYEGQFDLDEFYSLIKNWLENKGFFILPKEYSGKEKSKFKTKWTAVKTVDDFNQYVIESTIKGESIKHVTSKNKDLVEGIISISLDASMEHDYEGKTENKPFFKFFKEIYDKFIEKSRQSKYEKELKNYTLDLINEIKAYFNLNKV